MSPSLSLSPSFLLSTKSKTISVSGVGGMGSIRVMHLLILVLISISSIQPVSCWFFNKDNGDKQNIPESGTSESFCLLQDRSDVGYFTLDEGSGEGGSDGAVLMRHLVNSDSATISIEVIYAGIGWIGFAFTYDQSMIPNTAVIGLPNSTSILNQFGFRIGNAVSRYRLKERNVGGVERIKTFGRQSPLSETSIIQNDTHTVLTFTIPLQEDDNDNDNNYAMPTIQPSARNKLIWAVGATNELNSIHLKSGYDEITLDQFCSPPINETNGELSPTSSLPNSLQPTLVTTNSTKISGSLDGTYRSQTEDGKAIEIRLSTDPVDQVLSVEMKYEGKGWLGFGFPSAGGTDMIGSVAVIASIDINGGMPTRYSLTGKTIETVLQSDSNGRSSLLNSFYYQNDDYSFMNFSKPFTEQGNGHTISLVDGSTTNFIYAVGYDATLAQHKTHGIITATATVCAIGEDCSDRVFGIESSPNTISGASTSAANIARKWKAHGVCMALAWVILVPIAVLTSMSRDLLWCCFGVDHVMWFQIHRALNLLALLFTTVGFFLAVSAINSGNASINTDTSIRHYRVGLTVFILTILQVIGGLFHRRPEKVDQHNQSSPASGEQDENSIADLSQYLDKSFRTYGNNNHNDDNNVTTSVSSGKNQYHETQGNNVDDDDDDITFKAPNSDDNEKKKHLMMMYRTKWGSLHRIFGGTIIIMAWFNCNSGLKLYFERFTPATGGDLTGTLWGFIGAIVGFAAFLTCYQHFLKFWLESWFQQK